MLSRARWGEELLKAIFSSVYERILTNLIKQQVMNITNSDLCKHTLHSKQWKLNNTGKDKLEVSASLLNVRLFISQNHSFRFSILVYSVRHHSHQLYCIQEKDEFQYTKIDLFLCSHAMIIHNEKLFQRSDNKTDSILNIAYGVLLRTSSNVQIMSFICESILGLMNKTGKNCSELHSGK